MRVGLLDSLVMDTTLRNRRIYCCLVVRVIPDPAEMYGVLFTVTHLSPDVVISRVIIRTIILTGRH